MIFRNTLHVTPLLLCHVTDTADDIAWHVTRHATPPSPGSVLIGRAGLFPFRRWIESVGDEWQNRMFGYRVCEGKISIGNFRLKNKKNYFVNLRGSGKSYPITS